MTRFLHPPIAWRDLGRSTLRTTLLVAATALMGLGKLTYVTGARLQHLGEELR
jgi:hypothetical protein